MLILLLPIKFFWFPKMVAQKNSNKYINQNGFGTINLGYSEKVCVLKTVFGANNSLKIGKIDVVTYCKSIF